MDWLRAFWSGVKKGFVGAWEGRVGLRWSEAFSIFRSSILNALWERFVGVVVFLGLFSVGAVVLWVAWRIFLLLRRIAFVPLLLVCVGCGVDRAGLKSNPCATCDSGEVNRIDAKTIVLCVGLAACSSSQSSVDSDWAPGRGSNVQDAGVADAGSPDTKTVPDSMLIDAGAPDVRVPDARVPDAGVAMDTWSASDMSKTDARPIPDDECIGVGGIGTPCGGFLNSDYACLASVKSVASVPCALHQLLRLYVADCADCALYGEVRP